MSAEPVQCKKCGCLIHFSENNISRTGIPIPMNFTDNKFGGRGTNHNCRPQYAAPNPEHTDMHVFCPSCLTEHDRRIIPWCPTCFKLLCRKCNRKFIATTFNVVDILYDGEVVRACPNCNSIDNEMIEDVESWQRAWDKRQEIVGLLKCPRCKGKNWIGPPPLRYRLSTKPKDPNKSVTIANIVEDAPYENYWKE
jgi:hypothetical protein